MLNSERQEYIYTSCSPNILEMHKDIAHIKDTKCIIMFIIMFIIIPLQILKIRITKASRTYI